MDSPSDRSGEPGYNSDMDIILTHEQADFDAVASLLGAYLLNEHAAPVLPRRMNRNVRAFLNLFGAELPFIEPRDLPPNVAIDSVTLVDTQGLVTIKGISARTQVLVVDHHLPRPDLPPDWSIKTERLGACTTLFVESLLEHDGGALTPAQATLLLLGIYEDSGSLTYTSTTARDVRAAANLLELGADLRIAVEYLNPPLTIGQRRIYEQLLAVAQTRSIHGQTVVYACVQAGDLDEEISSVAHKMRDLLDPDALFLLVWTAEGVRLVARSTTDRINVAALAAHFGGGGHERAAAALIHPDRAPGDSILAPLERTCQELERILPEYIKPSVTVGQIMSRRPLVLQPGMLVEKAYPLIQRYGYEGYPVAHPGAKVVGLLTRRAVDRAMAHKLNLPVEKLMEAGEIFVHPQDTLEHLQNIMATTGWGQVPVVNPESGEITGIVTRTDLLKALSSGETRLLGRMNLAARLEAVLPTARLALLKMVVKMAHEEHQGIYIVGGFVRDLILERPSLDFDVVVEGEAWTLAQRLRNRFGGRIVSHIRFGTAKWWISEARPSLAQALGEEGAFAAHDLPEFIDLIGARTEFYEYPTALPTVERSSIKLDLHRRDFTINTLALRLDGRHYGELYDYWGGLNDLRKGLVRVLHSLSFVDDPTRMLRAVRFAVRFTFEIESRTEQLMQDASPLMRQMTGERLRHELDLILTEERAEDMLARLEGLALLKAICPDLCWRKTFEPALRTVLKEDIPAAWCLPAHIGHAPIRRALAYLCWLGNLPPPAALACAARLHLQGGLAADLNALHLLLPILPDLPGKPPSQVVASLDAVPVEVLFCAGLLSSDPTVHALLFAYQTKWRKVQASIKGDDLRSRGVPPGPHYRRILGTLRDGWLDGKIQSRQEEEQLLEELLRTI
jgi:tRNA nucleotidyltransferase (CCA-adding enzyme)